MRIWTTATAASPARRPEMRPSSAGPRAATIEADRSGTDSAGRSRSRRCMVVAEVWKARQSAQVRTCASSAGAAEGWSSPSSRAEIALRASVQSMWW